MSRGTCGQYNEFYTDDDPCSCQSPSPVPERMSEEHIYTVENRMSGYPRQARRDLFDMIREARRARESERDYTEAAAAEASERRRAHAEIALLKSRAARLAAVIPNLLAIIDAEVGECTCEQDWCSRCTEKALAEKGKS